MNQDDKNLSNHFTSRYLNINHLRNKLEELKNLDFSGLSQKELAMIFSSYIEMIPSMYGKYSVEKFNNFIFYRVRLNVKENEDLQLLRTYSYPLPQFCNENGRANLKNKSVFYSTNCALTAIIETKPKVGDIGYLSIWEGCTNRIIKGSILLPSNLEKRNDWSGLVEDAYDYTKNNHW
ncbi:MAG: hypothetical protein EOP43_05075 [Sphingobacteriaceae bacterium]|nr:MAG: hypothetical protein EOP43_05075 [Sphingobacteriaceae bacterium]